MPKTKESEDRRWARKAKEYQDALEAKAHVLVTDKCFIQRTAIVRWMAVTGETRTPYREEQTSVHGRKVGAFIRNLRRNTIRSVRIQRLWTVVEYSRFSTESIRDIQKWERLEMALAQKNGRNFHYAKWLMTKDMDKLTDELSGGMKRG